MKINKLIQMPIKKLRVLAQKFYDDPILDMGSTTGKRAGKVFDEIERRNKKNFRQYKII